METLGSIILKRIRKYKTYCDTEKLTPINFTLKEVQHDMLKLHLEHSAGGRFLLIEGIPLFVVGNNVEVSCCEICGLQYETEILHVCQGLEKQDTVKTIIEQDPLIKKIKEIEQRLDRIEEFLVI